MSEQSGEREFLIQGPATEEDKDRIAGLAMVVLTGCEIVPQAHYLLSGGDSSLEIVAEETVDSRFNVSIGLHQVDKEVFELKLDADGDIEEYKTSLEDPVLIGRKVHTVLDTLVNGLDTAISLPEASIIKHLRDFADVNTGKVPVWHHNGKLYDDKAAIDVMVDVAHRNAYKILQYRGREVSYSTGDSMRVTWQNHLGLTEEEYLRSPHIQIFHENRHGGVVASLEITRGGCARFKVVQDGLLTELEEIPGADYSDIIIAKDEDADEKDNLSRNLVRQHEVALGAAVAYLMRWN